MVSVGIKLHISIILGVTALISSSGRLSTGDITDPVRKPSGATPILFRLFARTELILTRRVRHGQSEIVRFFVGRGQSFRI